MQRIGTQDGLFNPGDPATNTKGTVVTAPWLNTQQEELAGVVEGLGGTLDPANNGQVLERLLATFADKGDLLLNSPIRFVAGGTGDAITGTLDPAITAYPEGLRVRTIPTGSNGTATPKINLNALGDVTVVKRGLGGWVPLSIEEWNSYTPVDFEYHAPYFYLLTDFGAGAVDNAFINGGMLVDQKFESAGTTFVAGANRAQAIDMWFGSCNGVNVMGSPTADPAMASGKCYRFLGAAGVTTVSFNQRIASRLAARFVGRDGYIRIKLASSLLVSCSWELSYANGLDSFGAVTQISSGTITGISGVTKEFQLKIPSIPANAANGLYFNVTFGAQTSGEIRIGDAKLGTNNKPFTPKAYEQELADCQFYYWATPITGAQGHHFAAGMNYGSGAVMGRLNFPRRMRAVPTVSISSLGHFCPITSSGVSSAVFTGGGFVGQTVDWMDFTLIGSSGLTAGNASAIVNTTSSARIYADANL